MFLNRKFDCRESSDTVERGRLIYETNFNPSSQNGPRVSTAIDTKICVAEMVSHLTCLRAAVALAALAGAI